MLPPNDIQASAGAGKTGSLTERLCRQAKAQPLKAATTGLLVCVLLALLLRGTLQPGKASAGNVARALLPTATPSAPGILSPEALLQVAMPALAAVQAHSTPPLPPRDIFAVDLRRFPKIGSPQVEEPLEALPADLPDAAQARLAEIKRQAGTIRLEGTVTGPARAAFLSGTIVAEGEQYRGFRLVQVGEHTVQLEREGVRLELSMAE